MATRWIKTRDYRASPHQSAYGEDDWLLLSGGWVVGHVMPARDDPHPGRYSWTLSGPYTSLGPGERSGTAEGAQAAKAALTASWQAWQTWAGLQDRGND